MSVAKHIFISVLVLILATSFLVNAYSPQNIYLNALPSTASYTIETDGAGAYRAIRYDGFEYDGLSLIDTENYVIAQLPSGGSVYLREVQWTGVAVPNNLFIWESYQGKMKCYSNFGQFMIPQLPADPLTAGWGAPEEGRLWYNTAEKVFRYWNTTEAVTLGNGSALGYSDDDSMYMFLNGTRALTANWNTGAFQIYGATWMNVTNLIFTGQFWYDGYNRTDMLAHPQDSFNFLVYTEGGVVYARTGNTWQVAVSTIQACVDAVTASGGSIIVKNGTYAEAVVLKNATRLVLDRGCIGVSVSINVGATAILEDYNLAITSVWSAGVLVMQYNNINGAVNGIYSTFTNFYGTNYYLGSSSLGFVEPATFIVDVSGLNYRMWYGANSTLAYYSTNATETIISAIGNTTLGGTVVVKAGIYNLNGSITATSINNVTLAFENGATLYVPVNMNRSAIYLVSCSNWVISGVSINGNAPNQDPAFTPNGIEMNQCVNCRVEKADIFNVRIFGFYAYGAGSVNDGIQDSKLSYCGWNGITLGMNFGELGLYAINNQVSHCSDVGITNYGIGCKVTGNYVHDMDGTTGSIDSRWGIATEGGADDIITGNTISVVNMGIVVSVADNCTVSMNTISNWDTYNWGVGAIRVQSNNNIVTQNQIINKGVYADEEGIDLYGNNSIVSLNMITVPVGNDVINYVGSATGNRVWGNDGYVSPSDQIGTASFIISIIGSTYYATNCTDGTVLHSSTNASQVINYAIGNETTGGLTHLKTGTYVLSNPILFDVGYTYSWILEGEGERNTILSQSTAGIAAIKVRDNSDVTIRDLYITLGATAGYGIWGADDGATANESWSGGGIQNVRITEGNANYAQIRLENSWYMYSTNVQLASGTADQWAMELVVTDRGISNYGNSEWDQLAIYTTSGNGIYINGSRNTAVGGVLADHMENMITFNNPLIFSDAGTAGHTGILIESLVKNNVFIGTDIENFDLCINITGADPRESSGNTFLGGYLLSGTNAIYCGVSYGNVFDGITTTGDINEASGWGGNTYQDINIQSGTITRGTYGVWQGRANVGTPTYLSRTASVTVNAGTVQYNITHSLILTPSWILLTPSWATTVTYVKDATWLNVTFGTTTGGTLTWQGGI